MKYRPDIDGIRAIAVLLVLFYHAHFSIIASGFIGVDIFFVISGFLITNIIVSEINTTGKFRFINFYKKRLWRLMPVFLVALLAIFIMCIIFYLPTDLIAFTKSLKKTILLQSNVFFSNLAGGYFSNNINTLPLVHTWSLSIEWQFYALLPFSLFCLIKAFKTKYLPLVIAILWLAFLILALRLSEISPTKTYYFLSSRTFELLTGSLLAVLPLNAFATAHSSNIKCSNHIKNIVLNIIFSGLGIISLGTIAFIVLQKEIVIGFPNYYALTICIATAILIAIGQIAPRNLITQILAFKPLVGIGLISYSLYIWHWPIFSTLRYLPIEESLDISLYALMFAFLLALCSWYFLERPARKFNQSSTVKTLFFLLLLPIIIIFASAIIIKHYEGFPNRFNGNIKNIDTINARYLNQNRERCLIHPYGNGKDIKIIPDDPACLSGQLIPSAPAHHKQNIKKALVIGDSFANHLWGFIDVLAKDANVQVRSHTAAACMAMPNLIQKSLTENVSYQGCIRYIKDIYQEISQNQYDYVILGQVWIYLEHSFLNSAGDLLAPENAIQQIENSLDEALQRIIKTGAIPIIVENTTTDFKNGENQCFYKNIKLHKTSNAQCEIYANDFKTNPIVRNILNKMQSKYKTLIVIDPKFVQCPNDKCLIEMNNVPIYSIGSHITDYASVKLGEMYLKRFGNPFKIKEKP